MKKSIEKIISLYEENSENKELCDKITSYICNRLPIEVVCWKKEYDKNKINIEKNKFINNFLNDDSNQFYYIEDTDIFVKYNNLNYSLIDEDELLYLILTEISKNKLLLSKKQMIKDIIIKEIKTNKLGAGIPESNTIQNIINYLYPVLFKTKSEAKYFLCILGDNILKKTKNKYYISRSEYMIFLNHINNCFRDYYNYDIINNIYCNFDKVIKENKILKDSRILDFKQSMQNQRFWQHFLDQNILNIISVAIHYSQRYDSEEYLRTKIEYKDKILYFKNNTKDDIIQHFKNKYIIEKKDEKILKKELHYLWTLFLIEENIPNIFLESSFFYKFFNMNQMTEYLNIFSDKLLVARKFNFFWEKCIIETKDDMIEISEIFYFFKQKTKIKTSSEREIIYIIEYFYPYIKIINNKYIKNYSCILWNKKVTIKEVINNIRETDNINKYTNIKLYKKYCEYLKKSKSELVVNKRYFMDVVNDIKNEKK